MKALLLAWLGSFFAFLAVAHGNLESLDSTLTMHAARALWARGDSGLLGASQGGEWLGERIAVAYIEGERAEGRHVYGKTGTNGRTYVWFPMGHLWLMVPAVAAGEALHRRFPGVEARYRAIVAPDTPDDQLHDRPSYRDGHFVFDHAMVALLLPAGFAATSVLLLFLLARALGAAPRDAAWSTAAIALATQFFPLGSETLSDGPGLCFLLAALLAAVRAHLGTASRRTLLLGGLAAGAAVLTRYQHGLVVPVLALAVAAAAWRAGRWKDLVWFTAGGLPCLLALLLVNAARFGDPMDTGYPPAASWFNYPIAFGLVKLLFAAGKGILWFSPMVWLAVPLALRRERVPQLRWLAWTLFAIPLLLFSATSGWQSGQCWGARYVTPGVVALCAVVLPQARPWASHRRLFLGLFAAGCLVNLTGVLAPTRGHNQLAGQAVRAMYDRELAAGRISQHDRDNLDPADHFFFLPRFSPLHANWTYAFRSATGGFEDERGLPRDGSEHTIEPLFGVVAVEPRQGLAPVYWEDRQGRHLWWRFWGDLLGCSGLWLLLPALLLAAGFSRAGWLRLLRQ